MKLKKGSKYNGLNSEILLAVIVANDIYKSLGYEMTLTEGTGGKHMSGSKHYIGDAVDIRTRNLPEDIRDNVYNSIIDALTNDYDVVLHSTHIHVEYDPK